MGPWQILLMYILLSVLEVAGSRDGRNHCSQHLLIAVATALGCPVCAKQDAACLIAAGSRLEQSIFQHIADE